MAGRCDRCGRFRKVEHLVTSDFGDEFEELATECVDCMSTVDRERFGMTPTREERP